MPLYTYSFFDGLGVLTHVEHREHPDDISTLDVGPRLPGTQKVEIWERKRLVARIRKEEMTSPASGPGLDHAKTKPLELDWSLRLKRAETVLARDYWRSLCQGRSMPRRYELSPGAMKSFLPHVGLIDVRSGPDGSDYFIRLAGSKWEQVFGPMKGRFIREFLPPQIEARWRLLFDTVCARAEPVRATTRIAFKEMTWLTAEMFVAPLGEDGISALFMCFTSWRANANG